MAFYHFNHTNNQKKKKIKEKTLNHTNKSEKEKGVLFLCEEIKYIYIYTLVVHVSIH